MAYAASIDRLLEVLRPAAPEKVDRLSQTKREVHDGLLSVGCKLHCLRDEFVFSSLIRALGGENYALERNIYRRSQAKFCLVLPPVGNARAAILLLECIEQFTGSKMFLNPNVQLQVCSPGRLNPRDAALHGISFYLSSDTLRLYDLDNFATTASDAYYNRGKRLVIYDAGATGEFDDSFAWWGHVHQGLAIRPSLPFLNSRTDILVGPGSKRDIKNINLIATLLIHAQSDGYWRALGEAFATDMLALLSRHLLSGLVDAPWVTNPDRDGSSKDHLFISALQELMAYAHEEAARVQHSEARSCILNEMQVLLNNYRARITVASEQEQREAK